MPHSNRQRGSALLFTMFAMIPLCAALGLVVDVGLAYFTQESAQTAAEAAAMAAAQAALDGVAAGGTYTCGSKGLVCQSATACPSTGNVQTGCLYAIANGFTNGGKQTLTMESNVTTPAPTVPGVKVSYWVTARIVQTNALSFGGVLIHSPLHIAAQATAAVIAAVPPDCVTALSSSANDAVAITGNANFNMNCGIASNSTSSSALELWGNITLDTTGIQVVGGAYQGGNISTSPAPTTGAKAVSDPFANVPAQTPSGTTYTNKYVSTNATLSPGIYDGGITITGNANVTFAPGTYFLVGGGLVATGNVTLSGSGVTFYNTFNAKYAYSPINLTGNINLNLSAPTSGTLAGMLFFEDRNAPTGKTESITGNSSSNLTGALYFPNSAFSYTGNSGSSSQEVTIVANTVALTGNSTFQADPLDESGPSAPTAALIQ